MKLRNAAVRLLLALLGILTLLLGLGFVVPPTLGMWRPHEVTLENLFLRRWPEMLWALGFLSVGGLLFREALRAGTPRFLQNRAVGPSALDPIGGPIGEAEERVRA